MSRQGFFARLVNLWGGMFGSWVGRKEESNPEAVYESAIQQRLRQYDQLKQAVAGVVYLRNKLAGELERKTAELKELQGQVMVAVEKGEDEAALVLIQKKDEVQADIERLKGEAAQTGEEAEEAKRSLTEFQGEIERLRREKERAMARLATLEARRAVQHQLDQLSPEADVQALESVRTRIEKLAAEQDAARETGDRDLNEKLAQIKKESSVNAARAQLEEMKKAKQEKKQPGKVEKTI